MEVSGFEPARIPGMQELPPPPENRSGWPWTEATGRPDDAIAWPKITIITPSFNQGEYLEETIRSVLLQSYPNLEYIIIDAGSTDQSVAIIRKYEPWLAGWVSEPDRGQSHAINKGFERSSGSVMGWINSDDSLARGSLIEVGRRMVGNGCDVLSGNTIYTGEGFSGQRKRPVHISVRDMLVKYLSPAPQPSTFWTRESWARYGPLDENLYYRMDFALFLCFRAAGLRWQFIDQDLAVFRRHAMQKTWSWQDEGFHAEKKAAIERFSNFDDFAHKFAREIEEALRGEGWFRSWAALNAKKLVGAEGLMELVRLPFCNWRVLQTRMFYKQFVSLVLESITRTR